MNGGRAASRNMEYSRRCMEEKQFADSALKTSGCVSRPSSSSVPIYVVSPLEKKIILTVVTGL